MRSVENKGNMGERQDSKISNFLLQYKQVTISSTWVSYRLIYCMCFNIVARSVEVDRSVLVLVVK